jgi:hypothetical protein
MGFGKWWKQSPVTTVSNIGSSVDDAIISPVVNTVKDELSGLDDFVNENVPGGWAGVITIAAGVYYAPEIGAYFGANGAPLTATEAAAQSGMPELLGEAGGNAFALEAGSEGLIPLGDATVAITPELTAQEVTDMIAKEQASAMSAQEIQAMIDAEAAASAAAAAATPTQVAAAKAAGMSVLDYVKASLLVNAITGDPLGLAGEQPTGGGGGATGFAQVPIPSDWRSPTYAASAAPIDLSSIFTDQNLLGGTQWQGLQSQQPNISFNDIFASGQQQTPMGNMVDINQIVSAILGQNTASQKLT